MAAAAAIDPREHAYDLIDRMAPSQVSAVVGLLETMLDPVSRDEAERVPSKATLAAMEEGERGEVERAPNAAAMLKALNA